MPASSQVDELVVTGFASRYVYSANPQTTLYGSSGPQYTVGLRYRY